MELHAHGSKSRAGYRRKMEKKEGRERERKKRRVEILSNGGGRGEREKCERRRGRMARGFGARRNGGRILTANSFPFPL